MLEAKRYIEVFNYMNQEDGRISASETINVVSSCARRSVETCLRQQQLKTIHLISGEAQSRRYFITTAVVFPQKRNVKGKGDRISRCPLVCNLVGAHRGMVYVRVGGGKCVGQYGRVR